jgi:hypothetical protein
MDGPSDTAEVYDFPDGFGLFVGDINQESSCALVPQINDETDVQRFMSMGNALNARLATEVEFNSDLNAETVSSVMSCNFDVSEIDSEAITITMAIANANDGALSTAVFIKSDSLRFEPTSINSMDIPEARRNSPYTPIKFLTDGTAPSSWSATGLPTGMSVSALGYLEGTPTQSGSFDFTLEALDENNETLGTQAFTIRVVEVPDLLSCPNQNAETTLLDVVVLSKFEDSQTAYRIGTDVTGSDTGIANILCRSPYLATTFFNGADGTSSAWEDALDGKDVLVIPSTSDDLAGSNLMSYLALEGVVKPWMQDGGRVILTDGTNHIQELAELIDVTPINLETRTESDSTMSRTGSAAQALPTSLAMSETNNSDISLVMDSAAVNEFYDFSPKRNILDLYGDWNWENNSYVRYGVASSFGINRGEVSFLSSNFASDRNSAWDKVLLQSIYGTSGSWFEVNEGGATWYPQREGGYWTESDSAARFEVGYGYSKHVANCLNTPSRPTFRIVSAAGTTIKCGAYDIQDGLTDGGVTLQVERFFSSSSPWMKSTINITNNDSESRYETDLVVGGSQAQDGDLDIEASSFHSDGTTNLGEYLQYLDGSGFAPETWTVASSGQRISIANGDWNYPIVAQVFGAAAERTQGGIGRNSWEDVGDDEIKATYYLNIEPRTSKIYSFFTGVVPFEAGCDRTAVAVAKQGAIDLQSNYELEGIELGSDGWPINPELQFPSLSASGCTPFSDIPTNGLATNNSSGTGVDLTWNNVQGATSYEVKYMSNGDWSPVIFVNGSAEAQVSTTIYGLARNTDYVFIVRAKRSNYGAYGDSSLGDFSNGILIRTDSETASPSPSSSATPTPSQSQSPPPTNEVAQVPAQIVPQMIAQTGPGFPARLKKGKTVKFGMTAPSGLPLRVTSVGTCKTTAVTKTMTVKVLVGKKVKKKKVKVQTGWAVKGSKKGVCTVTFSNSGDATRSPLAAAGTITIF